MPNQNEGPLDITLNISDAKTVVPMVADGVLARWRLAGIKKQTQEKGDMISFEWDLVEPAPSSEGTQIEPGKMGAKFFENVPLFDKNTPKGQAPAWALERIAKRTDALLGTGDTDNKKGKPARPNFGPELVSQLIGKELVAKMKVRSGDYVGNEFGALYFPGDIAA